MPKKPKLADPIGVIRSGHLPERTVPICLALDLVDEHDDLERDLDQARQEDSLAGGNVGEVQAQLDELRLRMLEATVEFRLRALPRPVFNNLKRQHPPRKGDDGAPVGNDGILKVNTETFFEALLRASIVEPKLDADTFRLLVDERLSDAQFEHLTDAAWFLNVNRIDLPFSSAALAKTRNSSTE